LTTNTENTSGLAEGGTAAKDSLSAARANYLLALLTLVGALSFFDRGIFSAVLQSIKLDLHISDTVIGLVAGLVFVVFYTIMGVPIAYLADRYNRRNIIVIGMTVWSILTSLTGFVSNVWQLATLRFLMGAGEASSSAPSSAMVADMYPKEKRPFVLGILWSSSTIGTALALMVGGWINQHYGWRDGVHHRWYSRNILLDSDAPYHQGSATWWRR